MEHNLIVAGVGGQGILTIAQAISVAVLRRGWYVKQAEVHGMSQRGGAVESHLRFSDQPLHSDLIPQGCADLVVAIEPLEALRYVQYLSSNGAIIASTTPFVNIPDYPPIEEILGKIRQYPNHVLVDADELAREAGSARAVNTVLLGAASEPLGLKESELDAAISQIFGRKGEKIVQTNQRACRLGRSTAAAYRKEHQPGQGPAAPCRCAENAVTEPAAGAKGIERTSASVTVESDGEVGGTETDDVSELLARAARAGRRQLYEHEVYRLIELAGAASAPRHCFVPAGEQLTADILSSFPGDKVVLKVVSAEVVHKTEVGAVVFVAKEIDAVRQAVEQLLDRCRGKHVEGILIVEFVEQAGGGFGRELFVGIRATREFGPVIAAGIGGVNTEYFAQKMKPSVAVARALALDTSAEEFLELFKGTAAYDVISGRARGQSRIVTDAALLRCFRAFIAIARRFGTDRNGAGPELGELEVNPFTFVRKQPIPLDGRGQLTPAAKSPIPRPFAKVQNLLEPRSIAVMGVSAKRANFGRIILNNVGNCGFPKEHLYVIKEGLDEIDGIRCVPAVDQLPESIDLLVVATSAAQVPEAIDAVIDSEKIATVILIPGGVGETEGSEDLKAQVCQRILASRNQKDGGPIFIGPNSMGIRSRPGNYDTFFIPASKLDPRRQIPSRRAAIISQSGAFIITRLSNVASLDPALAVSLGNQLDVTVSDVVRNVGERNDIDCIGVYVEGFNDLDGVTFARAVREITRKGKLVVFYKAGRTSPGRAATAGHTASIAGDYDVCEAAVSNAGGIVAGTFKEFEQLIELGTALHDKQIGGLRLGAISNAGFETVGMADNILGERHTVEMPKLSKATANKIANHLREFRIDTLVNARNPLDLTPMANEAAFAGCIRAMLDDPGLDALIVSAVPLTPQLLTTAKELEKPGSLAEILPELLSESSKPLVAVIDSGDRYEPLAYALRAGGVPTFRSADQAVRALGRYLCHRISQGGSKILTSASRKKGDAPRHPEKTPA